jgi:hypothetical protein
VAPTPKPPGQRTRPNARQKDWQKLPAAGREGAAPELPNAAQIGKPARDWWTAVWSSPMATVYLDADVPALVRAARLVAKEASGKASATELGELRQLEDRYGLSPLARRRLQWEIEQAKADEKSPAVVPHSAARQRRLQAVS